MEAYLWCNCGSNKTYISRLKKYALDNNIDLVVYETRYSESMREVHLIWLEEAGMPTDSYTPIIVKDGIVSKLKDFDGELNS